MTKRKQRGPYVEVKPNEQANPRLVGIESKDGLIQPVLKPILASSHSPGGGISGGVTVSRVPDPPASLMDALVERDLEKMLDEVTNELDELKFFTDDEFRPAAKKVLQDSGIHADVDLYWHDMRDDMKSKIEKAIFDGGDNE